MTRFDAQPHRSNDSSLKSIWGNKNTTKKKKKKRTKNSHELQRVGHKEEKMSNAADTRSKEFTEYRENGFARTRKKRDDEKKRRRSNGTVEHECISN